MLLLHQYCITFDCDWLGKQPRISDISNLQEISSGIKQKYIIVSYITELPFNGKWIYEQKGLQLLSEKR